MRNWREAYFRSGRTMVEEQLGHVLDHDYVRLDESEYAPSPGPEWQMRARRALSEFGLAGTAENVERLAEVLLEANTEAADAVLNGRQVLTRHRTAGGGGAMTISEAGKLYLAERTRDPQAALGAQAVAQARATYRLFSDFSGDASLDHVTRRDAATFLDTIARLHRHYGRQRGAAEMPLDQLLKEHPAGEGEGLSNKTLNRHATALSSLYRWARRRGHLPEDRPNPFQEQMRPIAESPWLPFTVD